MKKIVVAMLIGVLLIVTVATIAQADNGPHGKFNGSTEACASCHRAHSALSADGMLLAAADEYALCTSCHDGYGALTNVVDGYYDTSTGSAAKALLPTNQGDAGVGLFAGGFENTRMLTDFGNSPAAAPTTNTNPADINNSATAWAITNRYDANSTAPIGRPTTSMHDIGGVGTVWGSGNFQASGTSPFGAGTLDLECTSCHDPHGNAGRLGGLPTGAPIPSYRLLRFTPTGSNGWEVKPTGLYTRTFGSGTTYTWNSQVVPTTTGVLVPEASPIWYTVNNNVNLDPSLAAWRGRTGSGEIFVAIFAGQGDYGGRYYGYKRPAATASGAGASTVISCGSVPTNPGTACGTATGTAFNNQVPHDRLGYWCSTCHDRYAAQGGTTRTTDTTDPGYHYRHRSLGNSTSVGQYTCVDCHNAHGTSATASALSSAASYATGSVLLKADNRAICVRCHAGAVNFFNVTTSPTAPMVLP